MERAELLTLEEDNNAENEDGGKEVGDVGQVGAGQGLTESAELGVGCQGDASEGNVG